MGKAEKLATLEPSFRQAVEELLTNLETVSGIKWVITSARRTMAEQKKLYDQGRSTPGEIVTKAPPGSSAHNFGLAVDLCPLDKTGECWWNAPERYWKMMGELAEGMGLVWGGHFASIMDKPHIESADWRKQRDLWKAGKLVIA